MAGVPNPYYDPDWQAKHQACAARVAQWERVAHEILARDGFGSPRHRAAMAQQLEAKRAADEVQIGRFPTIGDFAAWAFAALPKASVVFTPDFAAFRSIEEVRAALLRARESQDDSVLLDEVSLPIGQPAGLKAFADASSVISSPRRFEAAELEPHHGAAPDLFLDCMVSVHQDGLLNHFCIAHRWGGLSPQSRDQFRNIATILARQAILFTLPEAELLFHAGNFASPAQRALIREVNTLARTLRFYRHMLPRRRLKEQFCRVDMTWDGARLIDPDWSAELYPCLPAVLRRATERFSEESAAFCAQ